MKKKSSKKPSKKSTKNAGAIAKNNPPAPDLDDLSFDRLPRTYTGLLDDVMIRYSEDYAGKDFFNRMIAKNIFFGGGFYINDGYLVNHATAREYLYDQDSLLRHMMSTGFIQVLTRKESAKELAEMPVEMAKGNASYNRLVKSAEWPEFSRLFKGISRGLFANKNQRLWPAFDMSQGFTNLMRRAFSSNAKDVSTLTTGSSNQGSADTALGLAWTKHPKTEIVPNPHKNRMDHIIATSQGLKIDGSSRTN